MGVVYSTGVVMRLSESSKRVISETVREIFGETASVRLFGSRVDDTARGGDIDLLVQVPTVLPDAPRKVLQLTARLQMRLGDQPVDILLLDPATSLSGVYVQACREGLTL